MTGSSAEDRRLGAALAAHQDRFGQAPAVFALWDRGEELAALLERAVARGEPLTDDEVWRELTGGPPPPYGEVVI